jgi:hypothetical protein
MFALIAAIVFLFAALGVEPESVSLLYVALMFWALHFAFPITLWSYERRRNPR